MNRTLSFALLLFTASALAACGGADTGGSTTGQQTPPPDEPIVLDGDPGRGTDENLVVGTDACETDADCVPAECCHPSACVALANAPTCEDVMCTQDCQYGTLDCGGGCLCHEGVCAARLSEVPEAIRESMESDPPQ